MNYAVGQVGHKLAADVLLNQQRNIVKQSNFKHVAIWHELIHAGGTLSKLAPI